MNKVCGRVGVHLTGIHSRSKKHVSASRDFDRGRIAAEEYARLQENEALALAEEQRQAGFDFVSDGQFLWQDLLRPFTESPNTRVGPLTRWFETNSFYKKPLAEENWAAAFDASALKKFFFWSCEPTLAFLPGPFSLHRLSENVSLENAALALKKSTAFLEGKGIKRIVFSEPCVGYHADSITDAEWTAAQKAFETVCLNSRAECFLHVYYGPCPKRAFSFPVAGIAVDLFEEQNLTGFPKEKILGLGVVDATTTLLETPQEVAENAERALKQASKEGKNESFFLCPNQALDGVPRNSATQKIGVLVEAATMI